MSDWLTQDLEASMKGAQGNLDRELGRIKDLKEQQAKDPLGNTGDVQKGYNQAIKEHEQMAQRYRDQLKQLGEQLRKHNPQAWFKAQAAAAGFDVNNGSPTGDAVGGQATGVVGRSNTHSSNPPRRRPRRRGRLLLMVGAFGAMSVAGAFAGGKLIGSEDGRSPEYVPPPVPVSAFDEAALGNTGTPDTPAEPTRPVVRTQRAPNVVVVHKPVAVAQEPVPQHHDVQPNDPPTTYTMTTTETYPHEEPYPNEDYEEAESYED